MDSSGLREAWQGLHRVARGRLGQGWSGNHPNRRGQRRWALMGPEMWVAIGRRAVGGRLAVS
jgi:hypothetical protein